MFKAISKVWVSNTIPSLSLPFVQPFDTIYCSVSCNRLHRVIFCKKVWSFKNKNVYDSLLVNFFANITTICKVFVYTGTWKGKRRWSDLGWMSKSMYCSWSIVGDLLYITILLCSVGYEKVIQYLTVFDSQSKDNLGLSRQKDKANDATMTKLSWVKGR